jgi:fatty acid desaturase
MEVDAPKVNYLLRGWWWRVLIVRAMRSVVAWITHTFKMEQMDLRILSHRKVRADQKTAKFYSHRIFDFACILTNYHVVSDSM